ncbi:ubiquinol-cytochrome c reductase iron-sulfur subunit [Kaustia mangrovi]|uniref:Ubiquinol-cytochrome c reductase iron-sulfur subunit n=1 Tax=Kaustia mangrovi TaxID=2593653 RepID=A0A7S8C6W1_9HYPH|nr:ubiquinol-cytochrome c reductase iron-sulfur subunit [Kaustia mangrovi]QPC44299.1 ubiquinol-cytochrome c reductase iron-sulfur subunit [Kaustia mangrovi]
MAATDTKEPTRRDFLYIATGSFAAVGAAATLWPFIDQMNPDASVRALAAIEVDLAPLEEGQSITVNWRGNPVFVRYRTGAEIEEAKAVPIGELRDPYARNPALPEDAPASDVNRVIEGKEQYLIQIGVCTHLGCVPIGESGDFDGWFCPCHGSHYDTAGRIRKGPAPENLPIPPYEYITDSKVRIG